MLLPPESDMDVNRSPASVSILGTWHVLGPFKTGTREATWGADPLEVLGGFRNISYDFDPAARFSSALGTNGTVGWSVLGLIESEQGNHASAKAKVDLDIGFPDVDWEFLRSVYGWAGMQYQAWARGCLTVASAAGADDRSGGNTATVSMFTDGLLEVWVDGQPYFGGDFYTYRRAPVLLKLVPGPHVVDLRLVRDVRALGGVGEPRIRAVVEVQLMQPSLSSDSTDAGEVVPGLDVDEDSVLVAEVVEGKLASSLASVIVRNVRDEWADITDIDSVSDTQSARPILSLVYSPITLAPRQSRPVAFEIDFHGQIPSNFSFQLTYKVQSADQPWKTNPVTASVTTRRMTDAQKYTFLHPGGIVSYAILRPPLNASCNSTAGGDGDHTLSILVDLHGAGLEAASEQVRHMLDAAYGICAWMLFPTGVTPWSGDDWHYVPFTMWHDGQAAIASVIQTARQSFKHELLVENFAGIPILQQHGSADNNVPAYHSRLLHQLILENGLHSEYYELPGKGHWFDGVLTTPPLLDFYSLHTSNTSAYNNLLPEKFSFSTPNSGDMGSRGGIMVDQLSSPDKYGHMQVMREGGGRQWRLKTRYVHRFHLLPSRMRGIAYPTDIVVVDEDDGSETPFRAPAADTAYSTWFVKDEATGKWTVSTDNSWQDDIWQRYGRQNGAMDAIFHSMGRFTIRICSPASSGEEQLMNVALQISRNLLQYFAADSQILPPQTTCNSDDNDNRMIEEEEELRGSGNLITVAIGNDLPPPPLSPLDLFPIHIAHNHLTIQTAASNRHPSRTTTKSYPFVPDLGAIFLRPRSSQRLELVVWGADVGGLQQASRLVPLLTGVGQPDFVVLSEQCRWQGFAGVHAAGFFDFRWQVSSGSYVY
ncbi:conserved hypothetical protein [Histoplasma capsulatum G186AR]|uniref:Peptidase S9 prolyl oligopeptidase catalytic domain-containing protein n=1 Tax=Ajellomyces capsulatus (strain G186AR / H82 / ATCC MYA-2454 / RMSCC 2432) TaxID=447093 RepID=C0P0D9_AJECG|nr:uncharacterized protein HCBG_08858 [Histoplasma capsulatum G186AR]EEH02955.1 conserved hypothetical protein [Histoplasma capsulatum G186AR]